MTNAASAILQSVAQPTAATLPFGSAASGSTSATAFSDLLGAGLQQTTRLESQAQSTVIDLLRGGGVEVHDAMVATQQSELTFELALQVRNKAMAAYQQMMQMQF